MYKTLTLINVEAVAYTEEEFQAQEQQTNNTNKGIVILYSMFAIAIHIVLCVEVFAHEDTASKVCSIVASAFFMLQHLYNHKHMCSFNFCCVMPVFIVGFALSNKRLVNTLAFIFQYCIWFGEHYFFVIIQNVMGLQKHRPKIQTNPSQPNSGNPDQIAIKIKGLTDTQAQEIKKDLNQLAGMLNDLEHQHLKDKYQQNDQQHKTEQKQETNIEQGHETKPDGQQQ